MNCLKDVIGDYKESIACISEKSLEYWLQNRSKFDAVFDMLSDAESRFVYGQELQFCMLTAFMPMELAAAISGNMTKPQFVDYINKARAMKQFADIACPEPYRAQDTKYQCCATTFLLEQYRYKNLVKIGDGDVCIDAGACLGDTAMYFVQNGAKHVYSFEIDKSNITLMETTLKRFKMEDKVTIVNEAISDTEGKTFFTPTPDNIGAGKIGAKVDKTSLPVAMTTIDAFCKKNGVEPTFIKMDVEGAEPEALKGAQETLRKYRPKCAVCIYHTWEHRWKIPLLLRDLVEDYDFYVKKSQPYAETVLFANPR